ncbi:MAG: hypothetical protein LIO94_10820 [Clostridiales bacterium]|nr:hypothetical protein [Clostridiales bacterium]
MKKMKFTEIRVKFFGKTVAYDLEGHLLSPTGYKSPGFICLYGANRKPYMKSDGESENR